MVSRAKSSFAIIFLWAFINSALASIPDTIAPEAPAAPPDLTLQCADDVPPPVSLTAFDNVDGEITVGPSTVITPGSSANDFVMVRTWTFTDEAGNSSSVSQQITVEDNTAPSIFAPADVTVAAGESTNPDSVGVATATENCDRPVVITFSDFTSRGEAPDVDFIITRTWTATDDRGNQASAVQLISVLREPDPDSDGDGVPDSSDTCPGTAQNAEVDQNGCSLAQLDTDNDGVSDAADLCPGTVIPEAASMIGGLKKNRYAITDDYVVPDAGQPIEFVSNNKRTLTTADTGGCSCTDIIEEVGLGRGHMMFGCSPGAMKDWIESIRPLN